LFTIPIEIAEKIVGYTKFFLVIKNIPRLNNTTINLLKWLASVRAPTGKMIVLAIKAASVAYAKQLNHLKILEDSFILNDESTPKNLER